MTERDEAGRYAALTPTQKLRAQIHGSFKPPTGFVVRIENITTHAARIEERLGIRHEKSTPEQTKSFGEVLEEARSRNAARSVTVTDRSPRTKGAR